MIKTKALTIENVKQTLCQYGFILISDTYINNNKKLIFKDKNGYYYSGRIHDIKSEHMPDMVSKSNPYSIQNIKLWCELHRKPFILLSDVYVSNRSNLQWKCLKEKCGEIFQCSWNVILRGGGCGFCHGLQVGLSNCLATINPELASEWHPTLNGDLTPYDVVSGSSKKVWWQCKKDSNHEWQATISGRKVGNGCLYCSSKLPSYNNNLLYSNPKLCEEWDYNKNDKRPEEYLPTANKKVWWKCNDCGHEWRTSINARNKPKGTGCPKCSESKGEKRVSKYLTDNKIYFTRQYRFPDCKNKRTLPFDFAIFEDIEKTILKFIIEYDGIHHYKDKFNHPLEFLQLQNNDMIKNKYCTDKNIYLLRIPYYDFDNIEQILNDNLKRFNLK